MALPPGWLPEGATEPPLSFQGGVLAEPKYQAFRHDLLIASFHPGHRAQWTAHELCHALVGFAYHPGASSYFHALAAWLAELLPVTLWYFFDEADVRKCRRHEGGGPLFQSFCEACEQAALEGPREPDGRSERCMREGRRYLKRELSAVARARKLGRMEGTRFATIDLAQDALRYAAGHAARLKAPEMERFVAQFFAPRQGHHASLEALAARVEEVCEHLCGGAPAKPWRATRWDYAAQDVGYRLLTARAVIGSELGGELDAIIDELAEDRSEAGLARAIDSYCALHGQARGRRGLVPGDELFAVGYELPGGHGHAQRQVGDGVASACPGAFAALGRKQRETIAAFCASDAPIRAPIGRRFARFLSEQLPGPVAELARVEAAITHVAPRDLLAASLNGHEALGDLWQLASGLEVVTIEHDVLSVLPKEVKRAPRLSETRSLLIGRGASGDVDVMELPRELAVRLLASRTQPLRRSAFAADEATLHELVSAGVLVPVAYRA